MMEAAEKAVHLDPNDGETHLALGQAYVYQGKREQSYSPSLARLKPLHPLMQTCSS